MAKPQFSMCFLLLGLHGFYADIVLIMVLDSEMHRKFTPLKFSLFIHDLLSLLIKGSGDGIKILINDHS